MYHIMWPLLFSTAGNRSPSTYRSSGSGGALYVGPVRQSLPSARLLIDNCSFENNTAPVSVKQCGARVHTGARVRVSVFARVCTEMWTHQKVLGRTCLA